MNKKEIIKGGYKFAEKEISKDKKNFTVIYNIKSRKYSSKYYRIVAYKVWR